ncbi:calmodulin calcium-dependent NAD kinase-like [Silene latifolia]|uniref:calmodulin calcium-dependent NAD kinase-like n=1 Tax=Silene latifolia TaxID=37657 RepID=UPI003D77E2D7
MMNEKIVPQLNKTESSGKTGRLERFSHYLARQIGFEDPNECPQLCKIANDYLKKIDGCERNIFEFLANEPNAEALYVKLLQEIDTCILSYFSFHWNQTSAMINLVLGDDDVERKTKLKDFVMAATRQQRFERVEKNLKVTRVFLTLVEEMKAIGGISSNGNGVSKCTEVMVPMAHNKRSPVLLLMGGGMGAGKSTVLKDILKEPFWSGVAANAVVVEADAFKETDVIYKALSSTGHHGDMLQTAELVHQSSTDAASSLLVTALNEGRDVIMDGTLSWAPFVEQTIEMARNVHKSRYRMGVGYKVAEDGTINENYWERVRDEQEKDRKPYRIELVGVVCDAYLAVVRGIRRAIMVKRAVRVKSQLQSHKRFASAFSQYCLLVDNARLYCTSTLSGPPRLIGWKDVASRLLVDVEEIQCLTILGQLNDEAQSIYQLHSDTTPLTHHGSAWKELVLSPFRPNTQAQLKSTILNCEIQILPSNSPPPLKNIVNKGK